MGIKTRFKEKVRHTATSVKIKNMKKHQKNILKTIKCASKRGYYSVMYNEFYAEDREIYDYICGWLSDMGFDVAVRNSRMCNYVEVEILWID